MRLLVTGFEPFGGETVNPAAQILPYLRAPSGTELITREIPVSFARGRTILRDLILETQPDVMLSLGQAGNRPGLTPEMVGVNLMSTRSADGVRLGADDYGFVADDLPIRKDGPAAYFATLPVREMVTACNTVGVPSAISMTAGTFVCNFTLYTLLDLATTEFPEMKVGFLHVPFLPDQLDHMQGRGAAVYAMSLQDMVRGTQAMLDVLK